MKNLFKKHIFKVDDVDYVSLRVDEEHLGLAVFAKHLGSSGGPTVCFSVPCTHGKFKTSGHKFDFTNY